MGRGIAPHVLADTVTAKGYPAQVQREAAPHLHDHGGDAAGLRRNFLIALVLTLPIFVAEMGGHAFPAFHHWLHMTIGQQTLWVLEFLLTTAVLAGPGRMFFRIGFPAPLRRAPEMNSLVALRASAAWAYSTVATFAPGLLPADSVHVYFEAAAAIVTLILLGRRLEARAKGRAGEAIGRLDQLAPTPPMSSVTARSWKSPWPSCIPATSWCTSETRRTGGRGRRCRPRAAAPSTKPC